MSNGHPPICDPACQKILLDADCLEHLATCLCDHVKQYKESGGTYGNSLRVIHALILAEKATAAAMKIVLEEQGYSGEFYPPS
jgi:RNA binding exosome subunit